MLAYNELNSLAERAIISLTDEWMKSMPTAHHVQVFPSTQTT